MSTDRDDPLRVGEEGVSDGDLDTAQLAAAAAATAAAAQSQGAQAPLQEQTTEDLRRREEEARLAQAATEAADAAARSGAAVDQATASGIATQEMINQAILDQLRSLRADLTSFQRQASGAVRQVSARVEQAGGVANAAGNIAQAAHTAHPVPPSLPPVAPVKPPAPSKFQGSSKGPRVLEWTHQAETYLRAAGLESFETGVWHISIYFEDEVAMWWRLHCQKIKDGKADPVLEWATLKELLIRHFTEVNRETAVLQKDSV